MKEEIEKRAPKAEFSREDIESLPFIDAETSLRGVLKEDGKLSTIKSIYEMSKRYKEEE